MSNWIFPTGAPSDPRRALPVFTLTPNWKGGVLERLEWLTEVLVSERAVEQRRSLRRYPRRSFEASFLRADNQRSRLDMFFTGVAHKMMLVPMWHEQFKLGDGRTDGLVQFPAGSLAKREYRLNDLVLASTGDPDATSVLTVTAIDLPNDTITLQALSAQGQWPPGTRITPLRRARIIDTATLTNAMAHVGAATLRFELEDADPNFTPEWGWYFPIFRFVPDRYTAISNDFYRQTYVLDNSIGPINIVEPGDRAQISASMALKFFGRDEVFAYRQFLYAARGKSQRFYVPTGQKDLTPRGNLGGDTLTTEVSGFYDYMEGPQDARKVIRIRLKEGLSPFYRTITDVEPVLGGTAPFRPVAERFTLDESLPNIDASLVERIEFVVPSRFDQDTFEIFHPVDDSAGVTAQVVTRSSTLDGMPGLEVHVLSRPYPVVNTEELAVETTTVDGDIRLALYDAGHESMELFPGITAGELRSVVKTTSADDTLDIATAITAGELRQVMKTYNSGSDSLDIGATVVGGSLEVVLITYDAKSESLDIVPAIIGGTLS